MKKLLRLIFVLSVISGINFSLFAQSKQEQNVQVYEQFKRYFKKSQTDSIYALTGESFQNKISSSKFESVMRQLYQLGPVLQAENLGYANGISSYKMVFKDASLKMSLGLDSAGKLSTFLFKPWVDENAVKPAPVASDNKLATALDRQIDSIARGYIQREKTVAMSIGILRDGKMHFYNYGSTRQGGDTLPSSSSLYEIGSISKTFTSLLLAYYVNEGKLKLDDPITEYLPDSVAVNTALKKVTLRMLANHTSGLPRLPTNLAVVARDPLNPYKHYSEVALYDYLKKAKPATTPGETYAYSNLGVAVLGNILEKIGGKPWDELVKRVITTPLRMTNTVEHLSTAQQSRMLPVYNAEGAETPAWEFQVFDAAGALRSTATDLLVYAQAQMKQDRSKLARAMALTQEMTYGKDPEIGLGWHINNLEDQKVYSHGGGTYGSRSFLGFVPERSMAVVVLSNSAEEVSETGMRMLEYLLKQ